MSGVYDFADIKRQFERLLKEANETCRYERYCVQGGVPAFASRECPHLERCPSASRRPEG
jgi:hypothetical protein